MRYSPSKSPCIAKAVFSDEILNERASDPPASCPFDDDEMIKRTSSGRNIFLIASPFRSQSSLTSELTRRRDFNSSFRLHTSSLQFTLPPLPSNDLLGFAFAAMATFSFSCCGTRHRQDKAYHSR